MEAALPLGGVERKVMPSGRGRDQGVGTGYATVLRFCG